MAEICPNLIEVADIQFKLQNTSRIFDFTEFPKYDVNLLATASSYGLVFIGCLEPKILILPSSALTKRHNGNFPFSEIVLPTNPRQISVSSDDSLLAVEIATNTGKGFIIIYSIPSVLSDKLVIVDFIRIPEQNVRTKQLLWNPVLNNILAVYLDNGKFGIYTIIDGKNTLNCLESPERVQSASWSPKGKQIIVGFSNGNMVQYKPDLKTARLIVCPPNIIKANTKFIAIQWLSTYQFAAVFVSDDEQIPCLYIINAPKVGNPVYIKYDDICYSQTEPRQPQVYLNHISAWNIILVASSNSVDVGVLGTIESGDAPTWIQWDMTSEEKAYIPMTVRKGGSVKEDAFPIGMNVDTSSTHQIMLSDLELPVMPMFHLLTTHGDLMTYNFLNLKQTYVNICSPPRSIPNTFQWGLSIVLPLTPISPEFALLPQPILSKPQPQNQQQQQHTQNEISFSIPSTNQSTPTSQKSSFFTQKPNEIFDTGTKSIFGGLGFGAQPQQQSQQPPSTLFGGHQQPSSTFNQFGFNSPTNISSSPFTVTAPPPVSTIQPNTFTKPLQFGTIDTTNIKKQTFENVLPSSPTPINITVGQNQSTTTSSTPTPIINTPSQPFITVPPVYIKPKVTPKSNSTQQPSSSINIIHENDDNKIIKLMIQEEIQNFECELKELLDRSKTLNINIGSKDESASLIKHINELQDVSNQAIESTDAITNEIQSLRISLNEAFSMAAEVKTKYEIFSDPNYINLHNNLSKNHTSQRQLIKLQNQLTKNEIQFNEINKQICSQWSNFEDLLKKNRKDRMFIPSLEVVYQTMTRQKDILNAQRKNLAMIKQKLGLKSKVYNKVKEEQTIESLTDSIISMSLAEQVKLDCCKLTEEKTKTLRDILRDRKVMIVRSKRPERKGINSEVIREKRIQSIKDMKPKSIMVKEKQSNIIIEQKVEQTINQNQVILPNSTSSFNPRFGIQPQQMYQQQHQPQNVPQMQPIKVTPKAQMPVFQNVPINKPVIDIKPSDQTIKVKPTENINKPFVTTNTTSSIPKFTINQTPDNNVFDVSKFGLGSSVTIEKVSKDTKSNNDNKENIIKPNIVTSTPSNLSSSVSPFSGFGQTTPVFSKPPSLPSNVDVTTTLQSQLPPSQTIKTTTPFSMSNIFGGTTAGSKTVNSEDNQKEISTAAVGETETKQVKNVLRQILTTDTKESTTTTPVSTFGSLTFGLTADKENVGITIKQQNQTLSKDNQQTKIEIPSESTQPRKVTFSFVDNKSKELGTTNDQPKSIFGGFNDSVPSTVSQQKTPAPAQSTQSTNIFNTAPGAVTSTSGSFNFGNLNFGTPSPTVVTTSTPVITSAAPIVTAASSPPTPIATTTRSSDTANSLFQGLSVCKPDIKSTTTSTLTTPANIFATASATMPQTSSSDKASSIFGAAAASFGTPPAASKTDTPTKTDFFTSTQNATPVAAANTTNMFGSISKPEQSVFGMAASASPLFGNSTGNIFGAPPNTNSQNAFASNENSNSPFGGGSTAAPQSNIFGNSFNSGAKIEASSPFGGQNTNIFGAASQDASSIFGGAVATSTAQTGSMFDMAATSTPSSGGSLFRSPTITNATSGGSLFGSAPGFGSSPQAAPGGGSIFGGGNNTPQMGSGFGSSFGQQSQTSSPPSFGSSAFGQTGFGSSSFGSPQAQKFGAPATFGGPATFNAAPTFGSNASFGSPKSNFGGFGSGEQANTFNAPTQQNTLFEQLGQSNESSMSFGNLAQTTNNNQPKPSFGGSAFTAWR